MKVYETNEAIESAPSCDLESIIAVYYANPHATGAQYASYIVARDEMERRAEGDYRALRLARRAIVIKARLEASERALAAELATPWTATAQDGVALQTAFILLDDSAFDFSDMLRQRKAHNLRSQVLSARQSAESAHLSRYFDPAHLAYLNARQARLSFERGDMPAGVSFVRRALADINRTGNTEARSLAFRTLNRARNGKRSHLTPRT